MGTPPHIGYINELLGRASCIILKDFDLNGFLLPSAIKVQPEKCIWYGVGCNYRYIQNNPVFDKYRFRFVSTIDMKRRDDDVYLPAPYDTDNHNYIEKSMDGKIILLHTPSDQQKGTQVVHNAISGILDKYTHVEYLEISNRVNSYTVNEKKKAHIFIDQMGKYHILGYNSIEAAAFGSAVVTDKRHDTDNPAIHAEPETLESVLAELIQNPARIIQNGRDMREWVVKKHGYANAYSVLEPFIDQIVLKGCK